MDVKSTARIYNNAPYLQIYPQYSQARLKAKLIAGYLCRNERIIKVHWHMINFNLSEIERDFPLVDIDVLKYLLKLDFIPSTRSGLMSLPAVGRHIADLVMAMSNPEIYPQDRHTQKIAPNPGIFIPQRRAYASAYIAYYKEIPIQELL